MINIHGEEVIFVEEGIASNNRTLRARLTTLWFMYGLAGNYLIMYAGGKINVFGPGRYD